MRNLNLRSRQNLREKRHGREQTRAAASRFVDHGCVRAIR